MPKKIEYAVSLDDAPNWAVQECVSNNFGVSKTANSRVRPCAGLLLRQSSQEEGAWQLAIEATHPHGVVLPSISSLSDLDMIRALSRGSRNMVTGYFVLPVSFGDGLGELPEGIYGKRVDIQTTALDPWLRLGLSLNRRSVHLTEGNPLRQLEVAHQMNVRSVSEEGQFWKAAKTGGYFDGSKFVKIMPDRFGNKMPKDRLMLLAFQRTLENVRILWEKSGFTVEAEA